MGCGESKIKKIDIKQDVEENGNTYPVLQKEHHPPPSISTVVLSENTEDTLPNRLLAAIPISDLGESLDSRHLSESFNGHILKNGGADRYVLRIVNSFTYVPTLLLLSISYFKQ